MGKRSTNTTKSGKFMNPTDQARKEARKRELKKNRKQRMLVRTAVLKGKDPTRILVEMAEVDDMEYNVHNPPSLGEKVLKEKRRKLLETFTRVMKLYEKEEPVFYKELSTALKDYHQTRIEKLETFEEVKNAERVQVDDIPLPDFPVDGMEDDDTPLGDIPLPSSATTTKGILKKSKADETPAEDLPPLQPPGPPPGPPPSLSDSEDEEDYDGEEADEEMTGARQSRKIRFDVEEEDGEDEKDSRLTREKERGQTSSIQAMMLRLAGQAPPEESAPMAAPPQALPSTHPQFIRLPPGPPPIRHQLPPGPPPGLPPTLRTTGGMVPPRPPPGLPPRMGRPSMMVPPIGLPTHGVPGLMQPPGSNVLSAPPSIHRVAAASAPVIAGAATVTGEERKGATIEAKPQIKHHIGDVTRFTPTALRVKRGEGAGKKGVSVGGRESEGVIGGVGLGAKTSAFTMSTKTKDDVYDEFMKEMGDMIT